MLAANQIQNSSSGPPCRSESGIGLIPFCSIPQSGSFAAPVSRSRVAVAMDPYSSTIEPACKLYISSMPDCVNVSPHSQKRTTLLAALSHLFERRFIVDYCSGEGRTSGL